MTPRRITRIGPLASGLGPLSQSIGRTMHKALHPAVPLGTPRTIPVQDYSRSVRSPIAGGYGSGIVPANGIVTVKVGPMGLGTIWYPQAWAIATTTGAADTSTCALYVGPLGLQTQIGGQSYAGGGDSGGLAVPPLWPGYFIWAVWAGATKGDLATLTVYGEMDSLSA